MDTIEPVGGFLFPILPRMKEFIEGEIVFFEDNLVEVEDE